MNLEDKLCPISCCISGKLLSLEWTYARNGRALAHALPHSAGLHPIPRSLTEFLIILPFSVVTIICIKWSGWKLLSHVRLCDPVAYAVHGILQAKILEWIAFPFSRGSSQLRDWTQVSPLQANSLSTELWGKPILIHITCVNAFLKHAKFS